MLRAGNSIRFTPDEIEEFRRIGIDLQGTRSDADVEAAVTQWVDTLLDERPDLLDRIATAIAHAKGERLPPRLSVVPSAGS
jgi:hypothetical protein